MKSDYLGEIMPLELITRCQGTLPLWKVWLASEERCLRQTPTWRGRCARRLSEFAKDEMCDRGKRGSHEFQRGVQYARNLSLSREESLGSRCRRRRRTLLLHLFEACLYLLLTFFRALEIENASSRLEVDTRSRDLPAGVSANQLYQERSLPALAFLPTQKGEARTISRDHAWPVASHQKACSVLQLFRAVPCQRRGAPTISVSDRLRYEILLLIFPATRFPYRDLSLF